MYEVSGLVRFFLWKVQVVCGKLGICLRFQKLAICNELLIKCLFS